ncbi:MAG: efflux RND transporter periplasmic adaptor subunit [Rhodoblastus sp.]
MLFLRDTEVTPLHRSILFLSLLPAAAGAAFAQDAKKDAPSAQNAGPAVVVQPATTREISRRNEFVGRIQAVERVEVRVRVTGTLLKPNFKDGETVKANQLLYRIEPAPFQAEVDAKKAQLASAKAQALNAEIALQRAQDLLRTNAGTKATFDQRRAEMAQANANVLIAEAALENSNITLGYTTITSPIDGRIGRTAITQGNIVSPATGPLTLIVKDDQVYALFAVSKREVFDYNKQPDGKKPVVRLRMPDGSFYDKTSTVSYIDNSVDKTDSQTLRATFDNPAKALVDDQTVRVVVEQPATKADIVVPQSALAADQSGAFVMIANADDKVEARYLKLGPERDGVVAVLEGLKLGDRVIVQGAQRVRPGMKVNVTVQTDAAEAGDARGTGK